MTGNDRPGWRGGGGRRGGSFSSAGLGLTLVAVLAMGGLAIARELPATSGAKPTPPATPTASSMASPPDALPPASDAVRSPALTGQPSPFVGGIVPGPDTTLPPGARPAIPGLRIEALAAAAASVGLACESNAGAVLEDADGYTLGCEGADPAAHAKFGLSASYWALDSVSDIHLFAWSDQPGTAVSPAGPIHLFSIVSGVSVNDIATTWVSGHLDDQACSPSCTQTDDGVQLVLSVGLNGGRQLDIYGPGRG